MSKNCLLMSHINVSLDVQQFWRFTSFQVIGYHTREVCGSSPEGRSIQKMWCWVGPSPSDQLISPTLSLVTNSCSRTYGCFVEAVTREEFLRTQSISHRHMYDIMERRSSFSLVGALCSLVFRRSRRDINASANGSLACSTFRFVTRKRAGQFPQVVLRIHT